MRSCIFLFLGVHLLLTVDGALVDEPQEVTELLKGANDLSGQAVADAIASFEESAAGTRKYDTTKLDFDDTMYDYRDVLNSLHVVEKLMTNITNVHTFLRLKGIDRVIMPFLTTTHLELQTELLMLIKTLFEFAPTSTASVIPENAIELLLDMFTEGDAAVKAHVLDILYLWLPGNPAVQAEVMKTTGLEPFYSLMSELDTVTVTLMLDLFNKILTEHVEARNETTEKSATELLNLEIYKQIGLLERVATPNFCTGILNIFQGLLFVGNVTERHLVKPVFDLMRTMKPFCLELYKGRSAALRLFRGWMAKLHSMPLDNNSTNLDVFTMLQDYIEVIKPTMVKNEL